jgi:fatty-acyl-CoA synthase
MNTFATQLSYVHGSVESPLIGATIGEYFDRMVTRLAESEALVVCHQGIRWTWQELHDRVDMLAVALIRLGLKPGERIGIWSQNNAEWLLTQLASAKAGLILVNINPAYRSGEVEHALNLPQCRALVVSPSFKSSNYLDMLAELIPELQDSEAGCLLSARVPSLRWVIRLGHERTPGMLSFDELLQQPSEQELQHLEALAAALQFDDPVNIQFTTGISGAPKGATLTHHNLLNNAYFCGVALRLTEHDRLCVPLPLYHCFGMVLGNLACLAHGATIVYPDESFNAASVLKTVAAERCTVLHGVPTMFIAILDHPDFDRYDLSTLRTGLMGGAPCPLELMNRVIDRMHMHQVTIIYGMTETSPVSFQSDVDDPVELRVSTVGRVQPHVEVKVVDENGCVVPRDATGELLTRGYSVMRGYWDDEPGTRAAIDEAGWMHTGDLATIDSRGYCRIVGRSKDMVIRGGENIYPREVEQFLQRHPKILEVQCVGMPDDRYGEELCACIILRPGEQPDPEEIHAFCRGRIARYKVPRYVQFLDSFPLTVAGKVHKALLREQIAKALGLRLP